MNGPFKGTAVISAPGSAIKASSPAIVQVIVAKGTSATVQNNLVTITEGAGGATVWKSCGLSNAINQVFEFPKGLHLHTGLAIVCTNAVASVCYQ